MIDRAPQLPEWPRIPARVIQERTTTVSEVQHAVQKEYGRGYKVKPFGSTCYGADSVNSDIDLVILVRMMSYRAMLESHEC